MGVIGTPIIPNTGTSLTVQLPPSVASQLITVSQVSEDNDEEVPVVRDEKT